MTTSAQSTGAAGSSKRKFFNKSPVTTTPRQRSLLPTSTSAKFYRNGGCEVKRNVTREEVARLHGEAGLLWLNIDGSHVQSTEHGEMPSTWLADIQKLFGFHELAMEDVRNRDQRAKLDRFDDGSAEPHRFIVVRIPDASDPGETEQISIFFRENLVVTIQESPGGDCLTKARTAAKRAAERGVLSAGLLVAEILDAAVMDYAEHLPGPEAVIDQLQNKIGNAKTDQLVHQFHHFRIEAIHLLRDLRPMEDVLTHLSNSDDGFYSAAARAKFKDGLDHQRRAVDTLNHLAEESKELMNLTLAMASHKMNEVMQVLTVVSAIFIPISFFAGMWGMNFEHMPELHLRFAYGGALLLFLSITLIQLYFFWRNDWLVLPRALAGIETDRMKKHKQRHLARRADAAEADAPHRSP